jgi:FMN reductase
MDPPAVRPASVRPVPVRPLIVGIGGTTLPGSSTERAVAMALRAAAEHGAETRMFGGAELAALPLYTPRLPSRLPAEDALVSAVRAASGLVIASPGYHGSVSGLVKNAIDLIEETARDERPYLTDLPVGLIATAYGWQATGSTIAALRSIVHALRGWPTPFAAAINSAQCTLDGDGGCSDPAVESQLATVGRQVAAAAVRHAAAT